MANLMSYLRGTFLLCAVVLAAAPAANAAAIFTFDVAGTHDFDTFINSFSVNGTELSFSKDVDGTSPDILAAVANGTEFDTATLVAYDTSVAAANELFRYILTGDVRFIQYSPAGITDSFTVAGDVLTRTEATAAVPEPASLMLLGSGLAGLLAKTHRRRR